jgi:hypothetical protein
MRHVGATVGCSLVLASGLAVAQQHTIEVGTEETSTTTGTGSTQRPGNR